MFGTRAPSTQLRRRRRFRSRAGSLEAQDAKSLASTRSLSRVPTLDGTPRSGITARQLEERRQRETEPGWSKRASVDTWQDLRAHLATCWTVPADTVGSSVVLRFLISAVGELRGPPMITATNVVPKDLSSRYRETALAVLQKCLPV